VQSKPGQNSVAELEQRSRARSAQRAQAEPAGENRSQVKVGKKSVFSGKKI